MTHYLGQLQSFKKELEEHPSIAVQSFQIADPLEPAKRETLMRGLALPAALIDFYSQTNGVSVQWSLTEAPDGLGVEPSEVLGRVDIVGLDDFVGNEMFFVDMHDRNEAVRPYHALELDWDNTQAWAFLVSEGGAADTLCQVDASGSAKTMSMGAGEYLERLLACRGIYGWQDATERTKNERAGVIRASIVALFGKSPRLDAVLPAPKKSRHPDADRIRAWIAKHALSARLELGRVRDVYLYYVILDDDFDDAALLNTALTDYFGYDHRVKTVESRAIGDIAILRASDPR